jgi:uncharacterized protein with ATP-grasp and redox domains
MSEIMPDSYPPPIQSTEPGSWAHSTVSQRFPEIVSRVIAENQFSREVEDQLNQLVKEIKGGSIRHLKDQGAPDQGDWRRWIKPQAGKNWLEVPWFFAEHYFYRRIMEAVVYFQEQEDPFHYQKMQGLENSQQDVRLLARLLSDSRKNPDQREKYLREGLYYSLWGNQDDLSLWPAGSLENPKHDSQRSLRDHLLADDIHQVIKRVLKGNSPSERMDIMLDNAGFELVADLGLVDILLGLELAETVTLHVKAHPTFVSDVIKPDLEEAVHYLVDSADLAVGKFGERLGEYLQIGRLRIREDYFWNSPLPLWKFPADLGAEWDRSRLLISKGDANYRRILGDRQWDFTKPFSEVVDYLPVPLAALRTLKAELAVGLDLDQIQQVHNQDRHWLTDGKWGVIHFAPEKTL